MTLSQKIKVLEKLNLNSLGFQMYNNKWQASAFKDKAPLNMDNHYPYIEAKTFDEVVNLAYEFCTKKE